MGDEFLIEMEKYESKQKTEDAELRGSKSNKQGGRGRGGGNQNGQNSQPTQNAYKFDAAISDNLKKKHAQAEASKGRKAQKSANLNTSGDVSMDALNNSGSNDSFESSLQMDTPYAPRNTFNQMANSQWQTDGMTPKVEKKSKKNSYFSNFSDSDNDVETLEARDQPSRNSSSKKKVKYTEDSDDELEEVPQNRNSNSKNDDDDDAIVELTDEED